jgi:hypothetical protein
MQRQHVNISMQDQQACFELMCGKPRGASFTAHLLDRGLELLSAPIGSIVGPSATSFMALYRESTPPAVAEAHAK